MAKDLNTVVISGNLGQDPELRYTQSDTAVVNLRLASNRSYRNRDDEWEDDTTWVSVVAWSDLAERVGEAFGKGDRIVVTGRLSESRWEDEDGNNRSRLEVVADSVQPMGRWGDYLSGDEDEEERPARKSRSNGRGNGRSKSRSNGRNSGGSKRRQRAAVDEMDVDDIPF